jgi:phytoene/squalene synthetase
MKALFDNLSKDFSKKTTRAYSTSFSFAVSLLDQDIQQAIYNIYGFVRFADEIVDTFHDYNKEELLNDFEDATYKSIKNRISLNPILNSFQETVHDYGIERELIHSFLESMKMDLNKIEYNTELYKGYIYGSADVVGLMCLRVFTDNQRDLYDDLKERAMRLGSAFQKVNFLRDLRADFEVLNRTYFPGVDLNNFSEEDKLKIESDIEKDFNFALDGIKSLPRSSRLGVYLAYNYYRKLFNKIKRTNPQNLLDKRVRIHNHIKYQIMLSSFFRHKLKMI